jgi:hypothetical protein
MSAIEVLSMWKLRAEPPRSTSVKTMFLCAPPVFCFGTFRETAVIGFVRFHDLASAAHRGEDAIPHRLANAVG